MNTYVDEEGLDQGFLPDVGDPKMAALVTALFDTNVGKLRKAVLSPKQAVALARAWAFAELMNVPALGALADMLADTTVSVRGTGLKQMVEVMSARVQAEDDNRMARMGRNLGL